jgi:hypothetical protein
LDPVVQLLDASSASSGAVVHPPFPELNKN